MPTGHPRHQLREFTVTVRHAESGNIKVRVMAQTKSDAILRAGLALGADHHPGSHWIVRSVHDPAPRDYIPAS
jgi:hypothetical protein